MNRYRQLREELGLTQVQLARIAGVSQPVIARRESGGQRVSRADMVLLEHLKTLPRERLDALAAGTDKLED
jgi:predicted transcriptional regulator